MISWRDNFVVQQECAWLMITDALQSFIQDFFLGGLFATAIVSLHHVRKHAQSSGVWGHALSGKVKNLQPLRLLLVAPETMHTVWFC